MELVQNRDLFSTRLKHENILSVTIFLSQCGKAGHFLSTDEYILKDAEQEKKFSFSLQKSLQTAQTQPLLKVLVPHKRISVSSPSLKCTIHIMYFLP